MAATLATAVGTVASGDVEALLVLLEGISGYARTPQVTHEVILENVKRQRMQMARSAGSAAALAERQWELTLLGEKDPTQKDAVVQTTRTTRLAATPGFATAVRHHPSIGNHEHVWVFLHAYGGFAPRSELLKVGYVVPLPDGVSVFVFALSTVGHDHDLAAARRVGDDWLVHVAVSTTAAEQARGKSTDVLIKALYTTKEAIAEYTDLQGRYT